MIGTELSYLHIIFEDRSRPFTKFCNNKEDLESTLAYWRKNYILEEVTCNPSPFIRSVFFTAKEKKSEQV